MLWKKKKVNKLLGSFYIKQNHVFFLFEYGKFLKSRENVNVRLEYSKNYNFRKLATNNKFF